MIIFLDQLYLCLQIVYTCAEFSSSLFSSLYILALLLLRWKQRYKKIRFESRDNIKGNSDESHIFSYMVMLDICGFIR